MTDFLMSLGDNPFARRAIRQLGLPVPLPERLKRDATAWSSRPLEGLTVHLGSAEGTSPGAWLSGALDSAGATSLGAPGPAHALVFDATGLVRLEDLRALYTFFHGHLASLTPSGRVLVLGRPASDVSSPEASTLSAALEGFVRTVAKEIGRRGATANLIRVAPGAEPRAAPVIAFVLSAKSAFITGQPFSVTARARDLGAAPLARSLAGKRALVTGAARGIGAATARLLAQEGAHVLCVDRPTESSALVALASEISGTAVMADVATPDAGARLADAVGADGLDVLVHNAGITRDKTLARMSPEQWDQVLAVNLIAIPAITRALDASLKAGARVICLSSVAGIAGNTGQSAYAATKAGLIGWVGAMASAAAPRGITYNAVAPGFIETQMTAAVPVMLREAGRRLSSLGQGGLPEDVAQAITFLATPGAQGLTGGVLRVCGGSFIGA